MTINTVTLTGNVVQVYDNGDYCKVIIADNYAKDSTRYIPVFARDKVADFARKYIAPGDHIGLHGYISCNDYKPAIQATTMHYEGYKSPKKIDEEMTALFAADNDVPSA